MVMAELGATILAILLFGGLGWWGYRIIKRWRWLIKYKIFRRPHNENDVKKLIQYLDAGMDAVGIKSLILLDPNNTRTLSQIDELLYIYSELEKIERRRNK